MDRETDMKKRIIAFPNFANAPKTFCYFLDHTKINDKLRRLLREEMILLYHCWFFMEALREKKMVTRK
jgi:hypothetical protein